MQRASPQPFHFTLAPRSEQKPQVVRQEPAPEPQDSAFTGSPGPGEILQRPHDEPGLNEDGACRWAGAVPSGLRLEVQLASNLQNARVAGRRSLAKRAAGRSRSYRAPVGVIHHVVALTAQREAGLA